MCAYYNKVGMCVTDMINMVSFLQALVKTLNGR